MLTPNLFYMYRPTQNTEGNVIGFSDYATGWRAGSSNPSAGKKFFLFSKISRRALRPT